MFRRTVRPRIRQDRRCGDALWGALRRARWGRRPRVGQDELLRRLSRLDPGPALGVGGLRWPDLLLRQHGPPLRGFTRRYRDDVLTPYLLRPRPRRRPQHRLQGRTAGARREDRDPLGVLDPRPADGRPRPTRGGRPRNHSPAHPPRPPCDPRVGRPTNPATQPATTPVRRRTRSPDSPAA